MDISDATTRPVKSNRQNTRWQLTAITHLFSQCSAVAALYDRRNMNSGSRETGAVADCRYSDTLRRNSKVTTAHSTVAGSIRWALEVRCGSRHPFRRFSNDPFLFGRRTSAKHAPDYQSNHSGQGSTFFHGGERTNRTFRCNYRRLRIDYESKAVRKKFCAKCEARL